ncbi:shikimate dehydrogenase [Ruficoccus sp. ZRK36]|uniref:shikimate dehydrogenase family protein n=1 Tax=Ruficoccus sp. ZRK36 TaxID=2866311 RepID=UPI001C72FED1|nr:shikimate dehydrogenase [Ruficoccus sp. ZRK36]QYY35920.1 shikimate dehydrogenase [Ruficoccus sp. ZRK36]
MNLKMLTSEKLDQDTVYTLEDLKHWPREGVSMAVLGDPVAHSLSPRMYHAALACMAQTQPVFADWHYVKMFVPEGQLGPALEQLWEAGFLGMNLVLPHKVAAVSLAAELDENAAAVGAVNTLLRLPEGGYRGYNTDTFGLEEAVRRDLGSELAGQDVILLGAGGASQAVAHHILRSGCKSLWIGNRSQDRLARVLEGLAPVAGGRLHGFDLTNPPAALPTTGLMVNGTSLGLHRGDPMPIALDRFEESLKIYDMPYGHENALCLAARERGMSYADGASMLVWQGVRAMEIYSGTSVPAQPMMNAVCEGSGCPVRHV